LFVNFFRLPCKSGRPNQLGTELASYGIHSRVSRVPLRVCGNKGNRRWGASLHRALLTADKVVERELLLQFSPQKACCANPE
jgi:hypothetical protein